MKIIQVLLVLSAFIVAIYPIWGFIDPQSYLVEILEVYPSATNASEMQVIKAAALLLLSNMTIATAFIFIAKFIKSPEQYKFAKFAGLALISYPIVLSIVEVFAARTLYSHLESPLYTLEFSSIKLLYILMGLSIIGIYKSQEGLVRQQKA
mgnify:CR=1 FL=1